MSNLVRRKGKETMESRIIPYDNENEVVHEDGTTKSAEKVYSMSSTTIDDDDKSNKIPNISVSSGTMSLSDQFSMVILLILYTLQGIPMGLCGSIPLILKEKGVSYEALSLMSLVSLPFSMKILWAPFVDTYYFPSFGRRKTWLIPIQFLTGILMIMGSSHMQSWLQDDGEATAGNAPDVYALFYFFIFLYFLMATQDIAVDGWALTMLSRESVAYSSTCNVFGQSLGFFLANQGLIALSDTKWCHHFLGMTEGTAIVTLPGFMIFWGYFFIITTLFLWFFKKEESSYKAEDEQSETIGETMKQIGAILRLTNMHSYIFILFTCRTAFGVLDGAYSFKLQEYGIQKSELATYAPFTLAATMITPALVSSSAANKPFTIFIYGYAFRLVIMCIMWLILQYVPKYYAEEKIETAEIGEQGSSFFSMTLLIVSMLNEATNSILFLSQMTFFSKISDPSIGGSYMTLLNTIANLGSKWPTALSLWLIPKLTYSQCILTSSSSSNNTTSSVIDGPVTMTIAGTCSTYHDHHCLDLSGKCEMTMDGYTILTLLELIIGIIWLITFYSSLMKLQAIPHTDWLISRIVPSSSSSAAPPAKYKV